MPVKIARGVTSMNELELLQLEYTERLRLLDEEFRLRLTAVTWGIVADVMRGRISAKLPRKLRGGIPMEYVAVKGSSKRQRYAALLDAKMGKWARRDSDNVYVCVGSAAKADHYLLSRVGKGSKTITVSLVSLVSRWNHIP